MAESKLNPEAKQWPWPTFPTSGRSPSTSSVAIYIGPNALTTIREESWAPRTPTPKKHQGNNDTMATSSARISNADSDPIAEKRRVYIGNIPYDATRRDIQKIISSKGVNKTLRKLYVPFNDKPGNKGFAFVTYEDAREAKQALKKISGTYLKGRQLVCLPCLPKGVHGVDRRGLKWEKRNVQRTPKRQDRALGSPFRYAPGHQSEPLWTGPWTHFYTIPYFGGEAVYVKEPRRITSQHARNDSCYLSPTPTTGGCVASGSAVNYFGNPLFNHEGYFSAQTWEESAFRDPLSRPDPDTEVFVPALDYAQTELPAEPTPIYRPPRDSFAARARTLQILNLPPMPGHRALESEMKKLFRRYEVTSVSEQHSQHEPLLQVVEPPATWCPDVDHICWPHSCFVQFGDSWQARNAAQEFQGKRVWHSGRPRRLYVEREWSLEFPATKNL